MLAKQYFLVDEQATLALGQRIARCIQAPMVIWLEGDLGMGKTTLTRGILRGLGYQGTVKSPTYTLVESYTLNDTTVHHFDLYRFSTPEEWEDAGLNELITANSIALIEWPQQGGYYTPQPDWLIQFHNQPSGRLLSLTSHSSQGTFHHQQLDNLP